MKIEGRGSVEQLERDKPRGKCRRWRLWVRVEGKNRSRRFNGAYREALAALEEFKAELEAIVPNEQTFQAYAQSWAEFRRESGDYDPNTVRKDSRHVRALSLVVGDVALDAMTPETCREALLRIKKGENASGRELSGSTMHTMHAYLNMILQQAADDGRIAANPMRKIKPPKVDTAEREALSPAEIEALLDALDGLPLDGRVMAVYLMACLGLRRGEACALMDEDVRGGFAHVRYAVKEADGSVGKPKSKAGARTLPVPPRLASKVEEWRSVREANGYGDAPTLACSTVGGVLLPQNLWRWWQKVAAKVGAEGLTLHQLRHSNLTMVARHLSPFDLQRYAGWASLEPAQIYIHEDMDALSRGILEAWGGTAQGVLSPFHHQKEKQVRRTSA